MYRVVILSTKLLTRTGRLLSVLLRKILYSLVTLKLFSPDSMLSGLVVLGRPWVTLCWTVLSPWVSLVLERFVFCLATILMGRLSRIVVIVSDAAAPLTFTLLAVSSRYSRVPRVCISLTFVVTVLIVRVWATVGFRAKLVALVVTWWGTMFGIGVFVTFTLIGMIL